MFIPNVTCTVTKANGGYDRYGQPTPGESREVRCSIIRLDLEDMKTSVRSDSSATRGMAREVVANARFMFPSDELIEIGDLLTVLNTIRLRVKSVYPRISVIGNLDHYQVDADILS